MRKRDKSISLRSQTRVAACGAESKNVSRGRRFAVWRRLPAPVALAHAAFAMMNGAGKHAAAVAPRADKPRAGAGDHEQRHARDSGGCGVNGRSRAWRGEAGATRRARSETRVVEST